MAMIVRCLGDEKWTKEGWKDERTDREQRNEEGGSFKSAEQATLTNHC